MKNEPAAVAAASVVSIPTLKRRMVMIAAFHCVLTVTFRRRPAQDDEPIALRGLAALFIGADADLNRLVPFAPVLPDEMRVGLSRAPACLAGEPAERGRFHHLLEPRWDRKGVERAGRSRPACNNNESASSRLSGRSAPRAHDRDERRSARNNKESASVGAGTAPFRISALAFHEGPLIISMCLSPCVERMSGSLIAASRAAM
jgi:hypothetical protein